MDVAIFYGSASGNTQIVCEKVANQLEKEGLNVRLFTAKSAKKQDWLDMKHDQAVILASPTYEHGLLEWHIGHFLKQFSDVDFAGRRVAVIGLGDAKYDDDYHLESVRLLVEFVKNHGGQLVLPSLKISKSPIGALDSKVRIWAENLAAVLKKKF